MTLMTQQSRRTASKRGGLFLFRPNCARVRGLRDVRSGDSLSCIEADGRLVYEGTCYKYFEVMVDFGAPPAMDIPKRYATGMKAGMYVAFSETAFAPVAPRR